MSVHDVIHASTPRRDSMAGVFQDLKGDGEKLSNIQIHRVTVGPGELLWVPSGTARLQQDMRIERARTLGALGFVETMQGLT